MELRHLRYFVAVAEELHFARAAERLNIAAPTLSHQIGALETMLGAKLLTRKTKSAVALTNAGKRFLIAAREALKQAAYAETVGRHAARGDTGSIAVGYVFSAGCGGLVSSDTGQLPEHASGGVVSTGADANFRAVQSAHRRLASISPSRARWRAIHPD